MHVNPALGGGLSGTLANAVVIGADVGVALAARVFAPRQPAPVSGLPAGGTVGQVVTNTGPGAGAWADQNKPAGVTVVASRDIVNADIGNEMLNTSGAFTLTIRVSGTAGFAPAALDVIFFHPTNTGTQSIVAGASVTLNDPYTLGASVPTNGLAAIQYDGSNIWSRLA